MRSLSGAVSRLSEAACPGVRGHCSAAWFHLSLFVRSCYNEPWSSIMQPSSRWWVVYVRGQQILSWVSNCTKTTVGALIIKTSYHYYKRYLWTCKHKTAQCLGEVFQCKRPTVHSSGANVSRRCIAVLSRITWRVIKIWTASLSAVGCPPCSHTHPFNGPLSGTTQVSRYQKGKTNLDFTEARQWAAVASAGPYASLHLAPDR